MAVLTKRRLFEFRACLDAYRYAVAAVDQVAISLFNFAVTFSLVHLLSAPEFGTYGLWIAVANLAIGVQSALVCTPLGVHAPAEPDVMSRRRLEGALGTVNMLFVGFACLTVLGITLFGEAEWIPGDLVAKIAIPAFIAAELYREYCRSIAYGRHDMALLLLVDGPYIAITAVFIGAMLLWPQHLAALGQLFIGLTLGGVVGRLCASLRIQVHVLRRGWTEAYRSVFGESMWMLAGVVSSHVQARSYTYITTALVGLAQLGSINAVGLLFRPGQTMLIAWRRATLPQLANLSAAGEFRAYNQRLLMALMAASVGFGIWCGLLWLSWGLIERYFLGAKYPHAVLLLMPWAIVAAQDAIAEILATGLQAIREFRFLAYVTMISAPVTAVATIGLTLWQGYTWTLYGLAIGQGVNIAMMVGRLSRAHRRLVIQPAPSGGVLPRTLPP